jgi:tRNA-2-methylthio-N6-dimethylallyladenosine synthase
MDHNKYLKIKGIKMKFYIETYGCQMNTSDSELVAQILTKSGYSEAESIDNADVIIFNTCTVRQHAEDRVLGRISNEQAKKQKNKNLRIGIIGCVAQRLDKDLIAKNIGIDFVVGVDQYTEIPKILDKLYNKKGSVVATEMNFDEVYDDLMPIRKGELNAFVTIMRGCNNFCTYCIVPYVRGRERSRKLEEIVAEVRQAGLDGFKDVTLLGQNVNSYHSGDYHFPDLLREVNKVETIKRIRFVTSHPKDLSDELIEAMGDCDKVCEHVHIALQSGNDDILERMNRGYTAEHFKTIVRKLRAKMPNIAVTTDVIAGFPGETEEQFMDTYNLMKEIEFDYAFNYKYSPRVGTKAAEYTDQLPEEVRLARLQKLIDLQNEITLKKYRDKIGSIQELYVEKVSKKSKHEMAGKTRDFKITVFPGDESMIGTFVKVKITDATGWTLKGELV